MRTLDFRRSLLIAGAFGLLAGCGAAQAPATGPATLPRGGSAAAHGARARSWMAPEAKDESLLYVADPGTGGVIVYSYQPPKFKFVGFLSGAASPAGECVDSEQNVFVTNRSFTDSRAIFKYAHGGTDPIGILADPAGAPVSCAVDPKTGNLAVVDYPLQSGGATLAIYKQGHGRPHLYKKSGFGMVSCGYDDRGNLFVDGDVIGGFLQFAELPAGLHTFTEIRLGQSFQWPGNIQWDGKHLAIGDYRTGTIYRFVIAGKKGTEIGSTPLNRSVDVSQFFIQGERVIAASARPEYRGYVKLYDYPAGGHSTRTLSNFSTPVGVVVSHAPSR